VNTTISDFFVNRERICQSFLDMLVGRSEKQIMMIQAPGGMGKSWLIAKLKHDCSRQSPHIPQVVVDFKDGQAHNYLSIIRRARDDFGAAHFNQLTLAINAVTGHHINLQVAAEISSTITAPLENVSGGEINIAGGNVIRDNFFLVQADSEYTRQEIEAQVTEIFFDVLRGVLPLGPVAFFFDTYEKAPEASRRWIEGNLLYQIREGRLPHALAVFAGREVPELDDLWKYCVVRPKLDALREEDVVTYLHEKRGLKNLDARTLYQVTKGKPQLLGVLADNAASNDDEW
jgi:hypothetical protein